MTALKKTPGRPQFSGPPRGAGWAQPGPGGARNPARRRLLLAGLGAGAPAFIRHARAADVDRFPLGVASGFPQPDRVVLWTRLMGDDLPPVVEVQWAVAEDEAFARIAAQGSAMAEAGSAHSVHVEPAGLEPGRWYFYRFQALGQRSATGRTRTAPDPQAPADLRLVLASCQRWEHGHWAAWQHAAASAPDLVLFVGDYIYEYASQDPMHLRPHGLPLARTLDAYRQRYALYRSDPALRAAHAAAPWMLVWDDHEVVNDYAADASATESGPAFLARRAAAYQAYWEHQPLPLAMRPRGPHLLLHGRHDWGRWIRLQRIDDRQYRDPQACAVTPGGAGSRVVDAAECPALNDPGRSLLGMAQERWLAEGWDPERPWNLLVQQTLMAPLNRKPGASPAEGRWWTDGWDGYPQCRRRVLQALADRRVPHTLVLGGDIHSHVVADLRLDPHDERSPMVATEICGTSISSRGPLQAAWDAARLMHPHLRHARGDERGYVWLHIGREQAEARLIGVERPADGQSPCHEQARFIAEAARPGARRA